MPKSKVMKIQIESKVWIGRNTGKVKTPNIFDKRIALNIIPWPIPIRNCAQQAPMQISVEPEP